MSGLVCCPTCRGLKFLEQTEIGLDRPIAAFDLVQAQARGRRTFRCWTCQGAGATTQWSSDLATIAKMRVDLATSRVLRGSF